MSEGPSLYEMATAPPGTLAIDAMITDNRTVDERDYYEFDNDLVPPCGARSGDGRFTCTLDQGHGGDEHQDVNAAGPSAMMGWPIDWVYQDDDTAPELTAPTMCDVVAALEVLQRNQSEVIGAINTLGAQVQWLTDGTMKLFMVLNSVGADLANMSIADKVKLIKGMMG